MLVLQVLTRIDSSLLFAALPLTDKALTPNRALQGAIQAIMARRG
jgi:hypothetical protein